MTLKEACDRWNSISLMLRILAGLAVGIALALTVPGILLISTIGDVFIGALKAIAPFLVFILVLNSLAGSKSDYRNHFKLIIALYIVSTVVAAVVAVVACSVAHVTVTLDVPGATEEPTTDLSQLFHDLLMKLVENPLSALIDGNYLGILFWAVLGGLLIRRYCSESTKDIVGDLSMLVTDIVKAIISFAPFGIMGLVYATVSENGMEIFAEYGQLILLLVSCMLFVAFVTNPAIVACLLRRNPYPLLLVCLRDSAVSAFLTRSSAANIPMNMKLCEKMGVDDRFCSVSIPLGATINMNGAAVTITVMTMTAAATLGMDVPIWLAVGLSIIATIGACGASGVAGGSLLLIPMACSLFGISDTVAMQMVAIGFIIGVVQDSFETALNSSSDAYYTIAADRYMKAKAGEERAAETSEPSNRARRMPLRRTSIGKGRLRLPGEWPR